jgi:hypothetical protein
VLLLLTIGLVLVGAVSLVIGFVSQNTLPIYISIACSVAAGLVLLVFSRMNRRQAVVPVGTAVSDDASGPATTEFVLQEARAAARPGPATTAVDDGFPIEDYDQLLVSEIVPLLPELDLEELDAVRAREEDGKARASILRRIDGLAEELEGTGRPSASDDDDADRFEDATVSVDVELDDDAGDDELFPIADYEDLRVNQILPLLPELDDDELAIVAERERSGADRYSILVRIEEDRGQEGSGEEDRGQEGSGQEDRRQEGSGQEGRSEEGSGQEGRDEEGSCQEGSCKEALSASRSSM